MIITKNIEAASDALKHGLLIAYPTEAVFGLGCDPFNEKAVHELLSLKHRAVEKGLILIAHDWHQIVDLCTAVNETALHRAHSTWPGPVTWVFPASEKAPPWICGNHPSIALRITQHPLASALCAAFGGPIVSTSANVEGAPPAQDSATVQRYFNSDLNLILEGSLGNLAKPTPIKDILTGEIFRS